MRLQQAAFDQPSQNRFEQKVLALVGDQTGTELA
jgi:hypothetical protein